MPVKPEPKFLSAMTRQEDGARFGLYSTENLVFPLLMAEDDGAGGFDLATARPVPFAEAFSLLQQINAATNKLN